MQGAGERSPTGSCPTSFRIVVDALTLSVIMPVRLLARPELIALNFEDGDTNNGIPEIRNRDCRGGGQVQSLERPPPTTPRWSAST